MVYLQSFSFPTLLAIPQAKIYDLDNHSRVSKFEELESKTSNLDLDEDFYGDSDYNIDELDRDGYEGFGDSVIDNPYDDDRY